MCFAFAVNNKQQAHQSEEEKKQLDSSSKSVSSIQDTEDVGHKHLRQEVDRHEKGKNDPSEIISEVIKESTAGKQHIENLGTESESVNVEKEAAEEQKTPNQNVALK